MNRTQGSDSSIAVKIIQLLARIRTRRVINEYGDCPDSEVYILLPGDDYSREQEDEIGQPLFPSSLNTSWLDPQEHESDYSEEMDSFNGFATPSESSSDSSLQSKFLTWIHT